MYISRRSLLKKYNYAFTTNGGIKKFRICFDTSFLTNINALNIQLITLENIDFVKYNLACCIIV